MVTKAALAIVVGVAVALLTALVGHLIVTGGGEDIGNFVKSVSWLVGLLAGLWYYFAGPTRRAL